MYAAEQTPRVCSPTYAAGTPRLKCQGINRMHAGNEKCHGEEIFRTVLALTFSPCQVYYSLRFGMMPLRGILSAKTRFSLYLAISCACGLVLTVSHKPRTLYKGYCRGSAPSQVSAGPIRHDVARTTENYKVYDIWSPEVRSPRTPPPSSAGFCYAPLPRSVDAGPRARVVICRPAVLRTAFVAAGKKRVVP